LAPYVRLLVESPFPVLYHVLIRKFPHFYRRCLKGLIITNFTALFIVNSLIILCFLEQICGRH